MANCLICNQIEPFPPQFPCKHQFCKSCLFHYLNLRIIESKVSSMPCPNSSCPYLLKETEIQSLIPQDLYLKYKLFQRNLDLSKNPNLRFCPKADCQGYDVGNSKKKKLKCNSCNNDFCYYCNDSWHFDKPCSKSNDVVFDLWSIKNNVRQCPNCNRRVEKAGGCPSMECPVCQFKWCWYCGTGLGDGHDPILCVFAKDSSQLRYWFIAFLVFGPVTVPFGLGLFLIHLGQNYLTDSDKESKFISKIIEFRYLSYPIIVLFSPALTVFLMIGSGFFVIYINRAAFKPYSSGCYSKTFKTKFSRCLLMFTVAVVTSVVISCVFMIVYALTPLIGVIFLIKKIVSDLKMRRENMETRQEGYVEI